MKDKLTRPYNPRETEQVIYKKWESNGTFSPETSISHERGGEVFSIVLPPPNVTGTLHIGHAFEVSIQDTAVRYARMRGKKTLWIPGTDHAAIATQSKVEKLLSKEGIRREEIGREKFLERVNNFAKESQSIIISQIKSLGASLDWSRLAFTLDEKRALAVRTAFKMLYDLGLIYRGDRIVNWDPKGQTVISDDEVVYKEEKTKFYYLKYGPFTIGTARPETKFGDKYVVVHPDDKRYAEYKHGQKIDVEWINNPITATVIKDESIDMEFGTGVMTITPWHSGADFSLALKHNLEREQIIDLQGKLLPIAGEFAGMKIAEAREKIVEKLERKGLLAKVEDYTHNIAKAERSGGIVEPQILKQWFIAVDKQFVLKKSKISGIQSGDSVTLKQIMRTAVESGQIEIIPERFKKIYFHWIDNLRDWCISRQLWYGHRIPVWYKDKETYVGTDAPSSEGWEQDPDTLDTWFSSGLWTFSTLGWPENTKDLQIYHPTTFMCPGYEILFFWVARMILMSGALLGEVPFKTVYLHGIVRDKTGEKFSKSKGTGADPLEIIDEYGADALRMALIIGVGPGNDTKFDLQKVRGYKHFANKIWNASRFVLEKTAGNKIDDKPNLTETDQKIIEELNALIAEISDDMENYRFHLAGEKLYHYFWHVFADIIIEKSKSVLAGSDKEVLESKKWTLRIVLASLIKLLHPFMPFITEELWPSVQTDEKSEFVALEDWPEKIAI